MTTAVAENDLEELALSWFALLGYEVQYGPDIAPNEAGAERANFRETVLAGRLREALDRLNPNLPVSAIDDALRKVLVSDTPSLTRSNHRFHQMLVNGAEVEVAGDGGRVRGERVRLVDFENPGENDWVAVNQFTVTDGQHTRRPDVVVFVNGLPLVVVELKNPADENATIAAAFNQIQTYQRQIPALFTYNAFSVVSDGQEARFSSLTADADRMQVWRTIEGDAEAPKTQLALEVLIHGLFHKKRLLDLVRHFTVFEESREQLTKKLAGYHQFHAVGRAVETTVAASRPGGDRRAGVVWHTQGSGKSLTMAFFAGRIVQHPAMENPTIVVLTDRNDLDDQLFGTFSQCHELLRQKPVQAGGRDVLRELLRVASGGIVFTTIQKFLPDEKGDRYPMLSDRRNIVVIADEAHRSQYGFKGKLSSDASGGHIVYGFAQHLRDALPNASFIGFTGTPIEREDRSTLAVFGDYISVYDIEAAVKDGATVPIHYESRLAKLSLDQSAKPRIDDEFEEVTEGEEELRKDKLKSRWAALEAIVGDEKRIQVIAEDLVKHYDARLAAMEGKAMIVCMSRRICVALYDALIKLKPEWANAEDEKGALKIVMTGAASDEAPWQQHIRTTPRLKRLAERFRDPAEPFRIVIVRDMWLTGFDAPCLHTMYVDKPMQGHGLMQAIARVNRVFRDKPGGLVVDYLGLADSLRKALATYTESGGRGTTHEDQQAAVDKFFELLEVCRGLFHGFDYSRFLTGTSMERIQLLPAAQEHVFAQEDGRNRLVTAVTKLSAALALSSSNEDVMAVRDEVVFFQYLKAALSKSSTGTVRTDAQLDHAIRQIVSSAIAPGGVVDIFAAAGLKKPDISILSDEFLADVRGLPHKNLAVELLRKLLNDELKVRLRSNIVQSKQFSAMLEKTVLRYQNRAIETAQVIEELLELARKVRESGAKASALGLTSDEAAFYDALGTNDSAVAVMGDAALAEIARELTEAIRKNVTIDWNKRETVRARLRVLVRRILTRRGYPPDKRESAVTTVLEQAEVLCADWAAAA